MDLISLYGDQLSSAYNALQRAFLACEVDFFLIGAIARDAWQDKTTTTRLTRDLDFATLIGDQAQFEAVKNVLIQHEEFTPVSGKNFKLISPEGIEVDLLPFGDVSTIMGEVGTIAGLANISVLGFEEVYKFGVETKTLPTGHQFKVATLPAIVLLKLVAYNDRPEKRHKDPGDVSQIINTFFDLQPDEVFGHHDLFSDPRYIDLDIEHYSAIVIGRSIRNMIISNPELVEQVSRILETYLDKGTDSAFITHMARAQKIYLEEALELLSWLQHGITASLPPTA